MTEISRAAQVANLANEVVSVKDFGAVGDGATNSSNNDTAAFTAALASGRSVHIPAGTYNVDTQGIFVSSNTTIFGDGIGATIVRTNSYDANKGIFSVEGKSDVTIKEMTLQSLRNGDTVAVDNTAIKGASGAGCQRINLEKLWIKDFGYYAIHLRNATDCFVDKCRMTNLGRAGFMGLGCFNTHVHNCYVKDVSPGSGGVAPNINAYGIVFSMSEQTGEPRSERCSVVSNHIENIPSWEAIDLHGSSDILISDNYIRKCAIGIYIGAATGTANLSPERVKVIGNSLYDGGLGGSSTIRAGILLSATPDGGTTVGDDFIITNNYIQGYGTSNYADNQEGAIDISYCRSVVVSNNNLHQNRWAHIRLKADVTNCIIKGNTFRRGLGTPNAADKIWCLVVLGADIGATFVHNNVYREGGHLNGIWVKNTPATGAASVYYGIRVGSNTFMNTQGGAYVDFEASTVGRLHESSSIFRKPYASGKIQSNGTIRTSINVTNVVRTGTGEYDINLDIPVLSTNDMHVTASAVGSAARIVNAQPNDTDTLKIKVFDSGGSLTDGEFQFQVNGKVTQMP